VPPAACPEMTSNWRGLTRFEDTEAVETRPIEATLVRPVGVSADDRRQFAGAKLRDRTEAIAYSTLIIIAIIVVMLAFSL